MIIETQLLKEYKEFISSKSIFGSVVRILPKTPQSFSKFPTIIFKEASNVDFNRAKTLNKQEYMDRIIYQVDIYTKDITLEGEKINSLQVISELKQLTYTFFRDIGFNRDSSNRGEYIDITVDRNVSTFSARINNWNKKII